MTKLFIICGLPGSGKTTLAKKLSKKLKFSCIHKDTIKETLYESLGFSTLEESMSLGKPTMKVLFALAGEQISRGVSTIIESPFNYLEDYDVFKRWQKDYGVEIISIVCEIDWEERERRYRSRKRHQAHHDNERTLDNAVQDYSLIPGKQIYINTKDDVNLLIDKIVKQL